MTYGFPTAADQYSGYPWNFNYDHDNNPVTPNITVSVNETTGFVALNAMQQDAATAAFRNFAGVTNMSALEQQPANSADVRLAMSNSRDPTSTTAYNFYPGDDRNGDGWFNTTAYNSPRLGTYAYQTFFHEIGHGLGLKHGHEAANGNSNLVSSDRDSLEFTTMTYRSFIGSGTGTYSVTGGHYPQTYMMLDIAALQYMYGADFTNNDGNTTYRFDPSTGEMFIGSFGQSVPQNDAGVNVNIIFRTIWDGNGIDTYDFSAYGSNRQLVVDLVPGGWTDVDSDSNFQAADLNNGAPGTQIARGQVFNSLLFNGDTRSLIENVIGGAGNDWIKGNQAGNHLQGRDGDDTLEGFDGSDVLDQGEGGGSMYGGNGNDILWAGPGAEIIDGGNDFDAVNYSRSTSYILIDTTIGKVTGGWAIDDTLISIEQIVATGYDDSIAMGSEANTIYAGNGADSLDGGDGPDQLFGEAGDDILRGGAGGDRISGGSGYDIATFAEAVTINLQTGARSGEAIGDNYGSIEQYNGSSYPDTLVASNSQGARFAGGDGVDYLYGLDREDWLQGGKGADYISGGNGFDMVSYADAPYGITAEMYFDADTALGHSEGKITAGEWGLDTLVSIEDVEGSAYGDVLLGDESSNKLSGLGGDDRIEGDGGTTPQGSSDILLGGTGNDSILIGASDSAYGGPDSDTATFVGGGDLYQLQHQYLHGGWPRILHR
jgi:serralysin